MEKLGSEGSSWALLRLSFSGGLLYFKALSPVMLLWLLLTLLVKKFPFIRLESPSGSLSYNTVDLVHDVIVPNKLFKIKCTQLHKKKNKARYKQKEAKKWQANARSNKDKYRPNRVKLV